MLHKRVLIKLISSGSVIIFLFFFWYKFIPLFKNSPAKVGVDEVKIGSIEEKVFASGKITSRKVKKIIARENGIVRLIQANEGDKVEKEDVLCVIKNIQIFDEKDSKIEEFIKKGAFHMLREYLSQMPNKEVKNLEIAKIEYLNAKQEYEQAEFLYREKAISREQLEHARIKYHKMKLLYEAQEKEFEDLLRRGRVTAPFSGTIIKSFIKENDEVKSGDVLFLIADMKNLLAEVEVDEFDINKIKIGQEARIKGETFSSILHAKVERMDESASSSSGFTFFNVYLSIINGCDEEEIKFGSSCRAEIIFSKKDNALIIPSSAVLIKRGKTACFVSKEGKAHLRFIEIGLRTEDFVEVIQGLKKGEKIITRGHLELKELQPIEEVEQSRLLY